MVKRFPGNAPLRKLTPSIHRHIAIVRLAKDDLGIGFRFHSAALGHSETNNSGRLNSKWLTANHANFKLFVLAAMIYLARVKSPLAALKKLAKD